MASQPPQQAQTMASKPVPSEQQKQLKTNQDSTPQVSANPAGQSQVKGFGILNLNFMINSLFEST